MDGLGTSGLDLYGAGWGGGLALGVFLMLWVAVGEALRRLGVSPPTVRRLVHAGVGLAVAGAPMLVEAPAPLYVLAVVFTAANALARRKAWLPGVHGGRPESWGTVLFPAALIPALALTWTVDPGRIPVLQTAFVVLACADPVAAAVGERWGRAMAVKTEGSTSWVGSAAGFVMAWAGATATWIATGAGGGLEAVIVGSVIAMASMTAEALGTRGWDNLWIVLAAVGAGIAAQEVDPTLLLGAAVVGAGFGAGAYAAGALTASGALGGGAFATSLLAWGGGAWALPGIVFFVTSSALSRVGRRQKAEAAHRVEKGHRRDLGQVLANGGVAWVVLATAALVPVGPEGRMLLYVGFLGSVAAAAADTWATELGALAPGRPRSIRTFRPVPPGTSGGVTGTGTLGGVAGAAAVVGTAALVPDVWGGGEAAGAGLLVAGAAGVVGMLVDSWAGATVQARYRDPETGDWTERAPSPRAMPDRGIAGLTNDRVNLLGTITGATLAAVLAWGLA